MNSKFFFIFVLLLFSTRIHCSERPAIFTRFLLKRDKWITLLLKYLDLQGEKSKTQATKNINIVDPNWNHIQFILKFIPKMTTVVVGDFNMKSNHPFMQEFYSEGLFDPSSLENRAGTNYVLVTNDLKKKKKPTCRNKYNFI